MTTQIDHLVIGAADLQQGVAYVQDILGVDIPYGGEHRQLGTHNHLMKLGNGLFFEIIAINPYSPPPTRPRWFGLDNPFIRQVIEKEPVLLTWVVNTENIHSLLAKAKISFGKPEQIHRNKLSWYFGLPEDGRLIGDGLLPYVIEWQTDIHPATNMADLGCSLDRIELYHPYLPWLVEVLESIDCAGLVKIEQLPRNHVPFLVAYINTPSGLKKIKSQWSAR